MVGQCTDATAPDCGLVNFYTGAAISKSAVHWILNDDVAAAFFGTPYGNVRRNPGVRGDAVNTINLNLIKNTRVSERVNLRLEANVLNAFNHMWRGTPDSVFSDGPGAFGTVSTNDSGGSGIYQGGVNNNAAVGQGLGQRRIVLGAHIIF